MKQRETAISTINGLRYLMALKLISPLNEAWNAAAFNGRLLDWEMVFHRVSAIKDCGHKILGICRANEPWTKVNSKKRPHSCRDFPPSKVCKTEDCPDQNHG